MNPCSMADIEAELREESDNLTERGRDDYNYLDGFKQGMLAAMCRQNGWQAIPRELQQESARLQKWLVEVCAK